MTADDLVAAHLETETARVVATTASFRDDAVLAPSLCEGWSRGHVLTHLARNADALGRVCAAALSHPRRGGTMYDSDEARDADVALGAGRSASALADDVRVSAERLAPAIARLGPQHAGVTVERTPGGSLIPVERVPFMRLREVVFHHVDLDAGFDFEHLPPDLARVFLDDSVARLRARPDAPALTLLTDEGDEHVVGEGGPSVSGNRAGMLLWLTRGRGRGVRSGQPLPTLPNGG